MADAAEIARRANELATAALEDHSRELAAMANGDHEVLRDAARIVQQQPQQPSPAGLSSEHLAFSLITAAYDLLRTEPQ